MMPLGPVLVMHTINISTVQGVNNTPLLAESSKKNRLVGMILLATMSSDDAVSWQMANTGGHGGVIKMNERARARAAPDHSNQWQGGVVDRPDRMEQPSRRHAGERVHRRSACCFGRYQKWSSVQRRRASGENKGTHNRTGLYQDLTVRRRVGGVPVAGQYDMRY